jgi:hypothetical protein
MDTISRWVALAGLAALACSCTDDVLDARYATKAEAVAAGATERGWIPSWVPPQASDLYEVHDVDTNESSLAFRLPAELAWRPPAASCQAADAGEFYRPKFDREWIPQALDNYDFYSCVEHTATKGVPLVSALAVSKDGQHVLHWRYVAP